MEKVLKRRMIIKLAPRNTLHLPFRSSILPRYRQCYRCHRPLLFQWGIPDLYSLCLQHYFRSTRNLAIECNLTNLAIECSLTIIAYLTCYIKANRSDGLISLGQ